MIRIGICDDESTVCTKLEKIILNFKSQITEKFEVEIFLSGEELVNRLKQDPALDLIFLDIELGTINGVQIGHIIREDMQDYITKIVYISSKDSYDRQLFEVQPMHFLSKPLEPEKVYKDISIALKMIGKENSVFPFKVGREDYRIPVKEIIYFESVKREVKLISIKDVFIFYERLDDVAESLSNFRFLRPHKSYLINYDHTKIINYDTIVMGNGIEIPVSRLKSKEIRVLQLQYENREV